MVASMSILLLGFQVGNPTRPVQYVDQSFVGSIERAASVLALGGFERPDGGEYRRVTLRIPTIAWGIKEVSVSAWIVADPITGATHAVAWNGLRYSPVSIGEPADLEADVKAGFITPPPYMLMESEEYMAATRPTGPLAAVMLHAVGRPDLAASPLSQMRTTRSINMSVDAAATFERILAGAAFSRFIEGEDWDALLFLRRAKRFDSIRRETSTAGEDGGGGLGATSFDKFDFDSMIRDINMRLAQASKGQPTLAEIARLPQSERIAAYKLRMPDTADHPRYYSTEVQTFRDTPAQRLLAEGEAGLEALIDLLDDGRSTRSLNYQYFPTSAPNFKSVSQVAMAQLLPRLLLTGFSENLEIAKAQVRNHWNRAKGKPIEMQWLSALENDELPPTVWSNAADNLSCPAWVTPTGNGVRFESKYPEPFVGASLKYGSLKPKQGRRIASLILERRGPWLAESRHRNQSFKMLINAAKWDLDLCMEDLIAAKADLLAKIKASTEADSNSELRRLAEVVTALAYAKHPDAWTGYLDALLTHPPDTRLGIGSALDPLWQHPDDPEAKAIAGVIFDRGAPYYPGEMSTRLNQELPMLVFLPEYRLALVACLQDTRIAMIARRTFESSLNYSFGSGGGGGQHIDAATSSIPVGGEIELRVCDLMVSNLSRSLRFEKFHLALSTAERDVFVKMAIEGILNPNTSWIVADETRKPRLPHSSALFVSRPVWTIPTGSVRPGTFRQNGGG